MRGDIPSWVIVVGVLAVVAVIIYLSLERHVRCPNCTTRHSVWKFTPGFDCTMCGTPILRDKEFVRRSDFGPRFVRRRIKSL